MKDFAGKIAFITGGASGAGLGYAIEPDLTLFGLGVIHDFGRRA